MELWNHNVRTQDSYARPRCSFSGEATERVAHMDELRMFATEENCWLLTERRMKRQNLMGKFFLTGQGSQT